jgi:hypothetical protein
MALASRPLLYSEHCTVRTVSITLDQTFDQHTVEQSPLHDQKFEHHIGEQISFLDQKFEQHTVEQIP